MPADSGKKLFVGPRFRRIRQQLGLSQTQIAEGLGISPSYINLIERYQPIVLTGVPEEIAEAPPDKRAWVSKHLGPEVQIRCCQASEKWMHAQRGDILIDDSVKHRKRWVKAGGIWITHRSAEGTVATLDVMGM